MRRTPAKQAKPVEQKSINFRDFRLTLAKWIKLQAGRSERIRTSDPVVPNDVRYQAALHSVTSGASIEQHFPFHKHQKRKNRKVG